MGTWSMAIFGNDTSCETKEYFFEQYNKGKEPALIKEELLNAYNMNDPEEKYNVLFALARCLWQTKALDSALLEEIKGMVEKESEKKTLIELGATRSMLATRKKAVTKLLADISVPKEVAKKRVKPPIMVDSIYKNGAVLAFKYDDESYGASIVVNSEFYRRKAIIAFALTNIYTKTLPTMEEVKASHLLDDYFDEHKKLHLYGSYFLNSKTIGFLHEYNESFFTVIGYLPEWKEAYRSSSSGLLPYEQGSYELFKKEMQKQFLYKYKNYKATKYNVAEITEIFEENK